MPVGHPDIIPLTGPYVSGMYYGLLKCKILPPTKLFHPVLPYRSKKRLLFPLCRTCADLRQSALCMHTDEERALTGTWITPEIERASQKGYIVLQAYEVWHFNQTAEYNAASRGPHPSGLFGRYINSLLKIKQEASSWPENVVTDNDKDQ